MKPHLHEVTPETSAEPDVEVSEVSIGQLVGNVYEETPLAERGRLLEPLLRSLGVLSLVGVANGIFAKMRFRSGGQELHVRPDDVQNVRAADVTALVDYVQKASVDAIDRLGPALAASPAAAGSAAAALLVAMLVQRARARSGDTATREENHA